MRGDQIDYSPLVDALNLRGGMWQALSDANVPRGSSTYNKLRTTYANAAARGHASIYHVDEVCCDVLHKHPSEVYGEDWFFPSRTTPTPRTDSLNPPPAMRCETWDEDATDGEAEAEFLAEQAERKAA